MKVFFTNDVEHVSNRGKSWPRMAHQVDDVALPRLLDLYDKYGIKSTFFVLGTLAEICPNVVKQILAHGQEVGSHGYQHERSRAFDIMSLEDQIAELRHSKDLLEQIGGQEVVSFRAPALRVNSDTPIALLEAGFKYDSSVAPQRMDAFMSYGASGKKQWLKAPRAIYETASNNLARRGNSGIIEVPVSAFGVPYIGTVMRIAPYTLTPITRLLLYLESKHKDTPVNFLFHPNETIPEIAEEMIADENSKGHAFSGEFRARLKNKNLNPNAFLLLERELGFWSRHNAEFLRIKDIN